MTYATFVKVPMSNAMLRRVEKIKPTSGNASLLPDFSAKLIREALDAREAKKAAK